MCCIYVTVMNRSRRTKADRLSGHDAAREIFAVFIQREKTTRALPKAHLLELLREREVYGEFLKLCMEYDNTADLGLLRKGLLIVVKNLGVSHIAKAAKVNRVTLYRMLAKGGNPGLKNLVALLKAIGVRIWVVDEEFFSVREKVYRRSHKSTDRLSMAASGNLRGRKSHRDDD